MFVVWYYVDCVEVLLFEWCVCVNVLVELFDGGFVMLVGV